MIVTAQHKHTSIQMLLEITIVFCRLLKGKCKLSRHLLKTSLPALVFSSSSRHQMLTCWSKSTNNLSGDTLERLLQLVQEEDAPSCSGACGLRKRCVSSTTQFGCCFGGSQWFFLVHESNKTTPFGGPSWCLIFLNRP